MNSNMNVSLDNADGRINVSVEVEHDKADGVRYIRLNGTHVRPGRSVRSDNWRVYKAAAVVTIGRKGGAHQTWNTVVSVDGERTTAPVQFGAVDGVIEAAVAALLSAVSGRSHFPVG